MNSALSMLRPEGFIWKRKFIIMVGAMIQRVNAAMILSWRINLLMNEYSDAYAGQSFLRRSFKILMYELKILTAEI